VELQTRLSTRARESISLSYLGCTALVQGRVLDYEYRFFILCDYTLRAPMLSSSPFLQNLDESLREAVGPPQDLTFGRCRWTLSICNTVKQYHNESGHPQIREVPGRRTSSQTFPMPSS
jgi:hypothetical protein